MGVVAKGPNGVLNVTDVGLNDWTNDALPVSGIAQHFQQCLARRDGWRGSGGGENVALPLVEFDTLIVGDGRADEAADVDVEFGLCLDRGGIVLRGIIVVGFGHFDVAGFI